MNCIIECEQPCKFQKREKEREQEQIKERHVSSFGDIEPPPQVTTTCKANQNVRVSTFSDALQIMSCGIRREIIENNRCLIGAITRSTLNTAVAWGNSKLIEWVDKEAPKWLIG